MTRSSARSPGAVPGFLPQVGLAFLSSVLVEIYRSRDGRWSIERVVDRYVVYDEQADHPDEEVSSCRTLTQLYEWMADNGLRPDDFEEVA